MVPCSSSDLWPGDPCRIASWFKPPSLPRSIPNSSSIEPSLLATLHIPFFWLINVKLLNRTYFSIYFVVFGPVPIFIADLPVLNCGWGNVPPTLHRLHSPPLWRSCLDWAKQPMYYRYMITYVDITIVIYVDICYICGYITIMDIYIYIYTYIWCIMILLGAPYPNLWGMITHVDFIQGPHLVFRRLPSWHSHELEKETPSNHHFSCLKHQFNITFNIQFT